MSISEPQQMAGADIYAGRIVRTINGGFTALLISIGHRTGLFDVLAVLPPATSRDIASHAGLSERYVREWLAAMAAAHIIDYDPRTSTWFLPIEYAAVLCRGAGSDGLGAAAQLLAALASVEDLVVAAFRSGGGVAPEAYDGVNELLAFDQWQTIDEEAVETLLELVPGLREKLLDGASVLDVGCGDGAMAITIARMFPRSVVHACDLSRAAILRATERAEEAGLRNVEFSVGDGAALDAPHSYDLVLALNSVHEHGFPRLTLRHIAAGLRPEGAFLLQEVAVSSDLARAIQHPLAPMLFARSCLHSVPVALAQDGEAFGKMWGEERVLQLLVEAGFRRVRIERLPTHPASFFAVARDVARS